MPTLLLSDLFSTEYGSDVQSANSGNIQNEQGVVLSGSEVGDVEFEGSSIETSPSVESDATQTIEQSTAASR